jgi:tRNA-splicing ligase RtcB
MIETRRIDEYRIKLEITGNMKTDALIFASNRIKIEDDALKQLQNASSVDDEAKVFATPDIHKGYGVPIGSIFASPNFISPSAVGYDINCGMRLITTGIESSKLDIKKITDSIARSIPLGEGKKNIILDEKIFSRLIKKGVMGLEELSHHDSLQRYFNFDDWEKDFLNIEERGSLKNSIISDKLNHAVDRGKNQLGTLGGGNHFIELQLVNDIYDESIANMWNIKKGDLTIMIHSGSRGFGHEIASYFMKDSINFCEKNKYYIADRQFTYYNRSAGEEYLSAMNAASNFAFLNRQIMTMIIRHDLRKIIGDVKMPLLFDISHNILKIEKYGSKSYFVHRKGATRAYDKQHMKDTPFENIGQPVLIPGSMGTSSYLLCGVESGIESFYSVNHGAGRVMGRMAASGKIKKGKIVRNGLITDKDFAEEMKNVYLVCENKSSIKEEAPSAYKNIDAVIDTVTGANLAKKVARFIPLAVLKG